MADTGGEDPLIAPANSVAGDAAARPRAKAEYEPDDLDSRNARFEASSSGRLHRRLQTGVVLLLIVATGLLVVPAFQLTRKLDADTSGEQYEFPGYTVPFLALALTAGFGAIVLLFIGRDVRVNWYTQDIYETRRAQSGHAAAALGAGPGLSPAEFAAFWQATYDRLTDYHSEAGDQLRSSYRLAQSASLGGFVIVLALGVAAAFSPSVGQSAAVGGIAAVGGALAAYVSHTFSATYQRSLAQRMAYFDEPVVSARLLAAERLLKEFSTDELRDQALLVMINAAVTVGDLGVGHNDPTTAMGP